MRKFAQGTDVSASRSRSEIEEMVLRYGATCFASGWDEEGGRVLFDYGGRRIRFLIPMPKTDELVQKKWGRKSAAERTREVVDAEIKRRWRALSLVIKAKLEAVASGVSTFESEFLAHIVIPSTGKTIGECIIPQLESSNFQKMPKLLGA